MSLYKYVTPERTDILTNKFVRFTQPLAFNDPFETFPCFAGLPEDSAKELYDKHRPDRDQIERFVEESLVDEFRKRFGSKIPHDVLKTLKNSRFVQQRIDEIGPISMRIMMDCFSETGRLFESFTVKNALDAMNRQFGVLCLAETPDNLLMWAHYSASHTGFVLEFDERHSFFNRATKPREFGRRLHKISYVKQRPERRLLDPRMQQRDFLDDWVKDIFFSKSEHWQYEQEWRMIDYLKDCENVTKAEPHDVCLFPIPMDCLRGIILGCRTSEVTKAIVKHILTSDPDCNHIHLLQAIVHDKEYALKIAPVW